MFKYDEHFTIKLFDGSQHIFKFKNGYGASVVKTIHSNVDIDGLWDLAVIKFNSTGNWDLCYDTEVTDNVLGWLTVDDVNNVLDKISNLK